MELEYHQGLEGVLVQLRHTQGQNDGKGEMNKDKICSFFHKDETVFGFHLYLRRNMDKIKELGWLFEQLEYKYTNDSLIYIIRNPNWD
jgi:hypothetical protein